MHFRLARLQTSLLRYGRPHKKAENSRTIPHSTIVPGTKPLKHAHHIEAPRGFYYRPSFAARLLTYLNIMFERFLLLCCISVVCVILSARPTPDPGKQAQLVEYLYKYGYLQRADPRGIGSVMSFEHLQNALKTLQRIRGLNETGSFDDPEAVKLVDESRCGVPDFGPTDLAKRKRRYAVQGTIWKEKELTYKIKNYPTNPPQKDVDSTVEKAIGMWRDASQLKFRKVDNEEEAQILISFVRGYHGDDRPADGPGKELAHAFFPLDNKGLAGDLHFDNDETYTLNGEEGGVDLLWIALHELGHSLGLDHSYQFDSIMFPFYVGYKADLTLDQDDIQGIRQLYGMPLVERVTPTPHTDPVVPVGVPDICNQEKIDTIVTTKDSKTYVFSGSYFWEIGNSGAGEPQKIKDVWKVLPDNIDAAFTRRRTGETYFFKGSKYWTFRDLAVLSGPDDIKELNLPGTLSQGMDAALEWAGNGRTYFFKGSQYWRYSWRLNRVDYGYPRTISKAWYGVPDDLDAAQWWNNGKTYFFKGGQYYALRKRGYPRVDSAYPKKTSVYWMGCSKEGLEAGGRISPKSNSNTTLPSIMLLVFTVLFSKLV